MPLSSRARSPLSIADEVFTALQAGPRPLGLHPRELADPDLPGLPVPGVGSRWDGPIPLGQLRTVLCRASTPQVVKRRAWSALAGRAQAEGGAWTVAAVGVALPRLVRLATELAGGDRDGRPELDTEVLGGFLQGLAEVNPASPQVFPFLLRTARRAGVAWLRHQRGADALIGADTHTSRTPRAPWGHPDLVLAGAVAAGVITVDEAALIGATRLEEISPRSIAARQQVSAWAVLKRRHRAEQRLLAYLAEQVAHTDTDDPTATHATTTSPARRSATPARTGPVGATVHRSGCPTSRHPAALYGRGTPSSSARPARPAVGGGAR